MGMKTKILIKLLYLITLFALATYRWDDTESPLIDSDPNLNISSYQEAYYEA